MRMSAHRRTDAIGFRAGADQGARCGFRPAERPAGERGDKRLRTRDRRRSSARRAVAAGPTPGRLPVSATVFGVRSSAPTVSS